MQRSSSPRTRLDKAIRRLKAQRACLDWAASAIADVPGIVCELGLGNGRTYDHLRARLPGRDIYVFERSVNAHPDAIPPADRLILGNIEETLPEMQQRFAGKVALMHSDIGTGDDERNRRIAAWLGPQVLPYLAPGATMASDQELVALADFAAPLPEGVGEDRYYLYRLPR
ncbi:MAG: class I SAM-dependent methyltransferase [Propylenella sp.]